MNNGTKLTDLTLLLSNISWNCDAVNILCPRDSIKLSLSSNTHLVSKETSHFTSPCCLGFHGGSGITSLMYRLAQPSQDGLLVPSQNTSFSDISICTLFLHGRCPSQTGLSASFMECIPPGHVSWHTSPPWTSQQNYVPQPWMSHGVFWAESFFPSTTMYIKTKSVVFWCCAIGQLASYWKVDHLLAVSQQKHVVLQLTFKSDIMWPTTGYMCSSCMSSTSVEWSLEVSIYFGPHIRCQIVVMGFLLSLAKRGSSTGPMGIQESETLDRLLDGRYIYWCTYPVMGNNTKEREDEGMKEKQRTLQQMKTILSTNKNIDKL